MFKNLVRIFVEKIRKMGCLEGRCVSVLYIGRTVPKGECTSGYDKMADCCEQGVLLTSRTTVSV
jgi:hypothetical protein